MKKQTKKNEMLNSDIKSTLMSMTTPVILGMIMLMTFNIVDTFFVSMLGTEQLAAISFTFPVTFTVMSLIIGLGIGTSAIIGKYLGSGATDDAKSIGSGAILVTVLLVGLLALIGLFTINPIFTAMGASEELLVYITAYMQPWYLAGVFLAVPMVGNSILRASGDTKTPSVILAAGGALNVVLDPILIFGLGPVPALGIQGAAIATAIAWGISVIWVLYLLAIERELIESHWLSWHQFKAAAAGVLKIGLPAAGANMFTPIAGAIITAIVATYGAESVAAWGVGNRLESIASIVILALSMSLPPFISQNYGADKLIRIKQAYQLCLKFIVLCQLAIFILLAGLSGFIAGIFAEEKAVADTIILFLLIVPLGYGFQGVIILTNSSMNAMHKPMCALVLSIVRLFVCYIPFAYAGSYFYGLIGLFWGCVIANVVVGVLSYYWFMKMIDSDLSKLNTTTSMPVTEQGNTL